MYRHAYLLHEEHTVSQPNIHFDHLTAKPVYAKKLPVYWGRYLFESLMSSFNPWQTKKQWHFKSWQLTRLLPRHDRTSSFPGEGKAESCLLLRHRADMLRSTAWKINTVTHWDTQREKKHGRLMSQEVERTKCSYILHTCVAWKRIKLSPSVSRCKCFLFIADSPRPVLPLLVCECMLGRFDVAPSGCTDLGVFSNTEKQQLLSPISGYLHLREAAHRWKKKFWWALTLQSNKNKLNSTHTYAKM